MIVKNKNNLISLIYNGHKVNRIINLENKETENVREDYEIPYISYEYFNPKPLDTEEVIIPLYITDYYQREYVYDDTSLIFKLRVEIDGEVSFLNNLKAGDYSLNLGVLEKGKHWFSVQVIDEEGYESIRLFNDLWVINQEEEAIKENEIYTITDGDLSNYNINKENSEIEEDMINNRVGLTQLFKSLQENGYRKCILPQGIYRVNRTIRRGNIENKTTCITLPTNFTVDMNGSTFKLHPYSDAEYGNIAGVENLIVRFEGCEDSHLINGTIEGDYAERKSKGWISGGNGEHNNAIYMYGGRYNSLENLTITQITGYNVCTGQNGSLANMKNSDGFTDNIFIENGMEITKMGYCTSGYVDLSNAIPNNYIVLSVWLAFGGIKGHHWDVDFNFYDQDKRFIEKIKSSQYRRCRIPNGAKYVRATLRCSATETNNLSFHHMDVLRYSEWKNLEFIDNRTCSAPFQFQHLLIKDCNYTRSGQSITPCAIDLEDGWEQMQDFFLMNCNVVECANGLIDNCGINHVIDNCKGLSITLRYRINGITVKNCSNCNLGIVSGYMTKNSIRVFDNILTGVSLSDTGKFYNYNKTKLCIKNNVLNFIGTEGWNDLYEVKNNEIKITGYSGNVNLKKSTVQIKSGTAYIYDCIYTDCVFNLYDGDTYTKFSFNGSDDKRIYKNCTFNCECEFANHNSFNSGLWENCIFKEKITLKNSTATKVVGEIAFNNCTFEKEVVVASSKNSYVQFNNCTFLNGISYSSSTAQNLCEINDEVNPNVTYIRVDRPLEFIEMNKQYQFTSFLLPFYATNTDVNWSVNNSSLGHIDNNGLLLTKNIEGDISIICSNDYGTIGETSCKIVDVDYVKGVCYNSDGGYNNYVGSACDNRYIEIIGSKNITIASPNVNVNRIIVVEYNENKDMINFTSQTTSNKSLTLELNENTRYIRISFWFNIYETKMAQLFYEYTITQN